VAGAGLGLRAARPAHAERPFGAFDWHIAATGQENQWLLSGRTVRLVNVTLTGDDVLAYGERTFGINLVWQPNVGQENIRFEKAEGGTINEGDRVALHVQNGGYVKYGERDFGINLVWY
jgi:hypothetical protein